MSLAKQLAAARKRRKDRHARQRENLQRQALAAGTQVPMSKREKLELVAAAWTAQDFLHDLDALLRARDAKLWLVWKGKLGQLYIESPAGYEVLQQANKQRRTLTLETPGDIGSRLYALLDLHRVEIRIGWASGELVAQCGSRDVSDTHCMRIIATGEGKRCRYMLTDEDKAPTSRTGASA